MASLREIFWDLSCLTIFINDLPDIVQSTCKVFADDTKLYDVPQRYQTIQNDIDNLQKWSDKWNLYFNVSKCKVLHMGKNNPRHDYSMMVNDEMKTVMKCEEEKDLGVTFDDHLSFDKHIQNIINKANKMLGIIKRTFSYLDNDTFTKLYKALVRPHLEYANVIWHPYLKRQSAALERVQRRATKLVKALKNMTYVERLRVLNLPTLKSRRLRGDLIRTYKIFQGIDNVKVESFFKKSTTDVTRKNTDKIFIEFSKTNIRKHSFSNRVAPSWNTLSDVVKNAQTINTFKNLLDIQKLMTESLYLYDN